jgi:hypothetical protein
MHLLKTANGKLPSRRTKSKHYFRLIFAYGLQLCRRGQKLAVLKSGKTGISGCLAIVAGKVLAQSFVHALVEKNPHSRLGGQKLLRLLERGDGHLSRNGRITLKELFEGMPSF